WSWGFVHENFQCRSWARCVVDCVGHVLITCGCLIKRQASESSPERSHLIIDLRRGVGHVLVALPLRKVLGDGSHARQLKLHQQSASSKPTVCWAVASKPTRSCPSPSDSLRFSGSSAGSFPSLSDSLGSSGSSPRIPDSPRSVLTSAANGASVGPPLSNLQRLSDSRSDSSLSVDSRGAVIVHELRAITPTVNGLVTVLRVLAIRNNSTCVRLFLVCIFRCNALVLCMFPEVNILSTKETRQYLWRIPKLLEVVVIVEWLGLGCVADRGEKLLSRSVGATLEVTCVEEKARNLPFACILRLLLVL
ncbi:hypothetical protein TOPH_03979, partial [Tolypocladium ophioglossoides CBS 100239]